MGTTYESIDAGLREFIAVQSVFFTATAPSGPGGHVNVSPKGMAGCFAILDERRVAFLDFTGSGAEGIAHLRQNGRITIMFCAFSGRPKILRLYGRGRVHYPGESEFTGLLDNFDRREHHGLRAVVDVTVERISTSCGYGVPLMEYTGDRDLLDSWSAKRTPDRLVEYRVERNAVSIDGLPAYPVPSDDRLPAYPVAEVSATTGPSAV